MSVECDVVRASRGSGGTALKCSFCGKKISTSMKDTHKLVVEGGSNYHRLCLNEKKLSAAGSFDKKGKKGK